MLYGAYENSWLEGIPQEMREALSTDLAEHRAKSRSELTLLSDRSGRIVGFDGGLKKVQLAILATVVAGFFSALSEVGRMIGEPRFSVNQYYDGVFYKLYLDAVGRNYFLLAVYRGHVQQGLVRAVSDRIIKSLGEKLGNLKLEAMEAEAATVIDTDFARQLKDSLGKLLGN